METVALLASGPSMSQEVADSVRHLRCIAVGDAYKLAPWSEAIVAQDLKWWHSHPDAMTSHIPLKYSTSWFQGVSRIRSSDRIFSGTNSGLCALHVAIERGARQILLLGFDMRGTHFFGPHVGLSNTTPQRFKEFIEQFRTYARKIPTGVEVWNCTPGSALDVFPFADANELLKAAA